MAEIKLETIPVGTLGIIAMDNIMPLAEKVDAYLAYWRSERERAKAAGLSSDVARASRGIAATGTCVVVTDDEETRLATMLPEVSIIVLNASDIVPDLPDIAPFLRERQTVGRASYTSFITGPSRTADIERVSAIGVHGPLELVIVLVEANA